MATNMMNDPNFREELKAAVTQHGWVVVPMLGNEQDALPDFAHTIGLWGNFRHPEILVMGLPGEAAQALLHRLSSMVKEGKQLPVHADITGVIEDLPVRLLPVDASNIPDFFGAAAIQYDGFTFPALQMVWADKAGKWPWEREFDSALAWRQLFLHTPIAFKFMESEDTPVFATGEVLNGSHPVIAVFRDAQGRWNFLHATEVEGPAMQTTLGAMVERDASLNSLFTMPRNVIAVRQAPDAGWEWFQFNADAQ
ncbi:hypothetical protein DCC81_13770 [Chitinophaga parva]|uniref:DUF4262 domain-containing protein n=1 Tax=Chitinophaga parva TaxID=2169414 RepID=A0A2T7BGE8_9BACT|nr:DUF4262 domain-containing protein [Chitinophaga parva]PUZ25362.1 hypothetical protein DCC81_13770 [Chitinophaga parva]